MGFLTGAFLSIYLARQRLQIQHQMTSVMSRLNRVTKQMGDAQKQLTRMKQMQSMNMKALQSYAMKGASAAMNQSIFDLQQQGLSDAQMSSQMMAINSAFTMKQQDIALQFSQMQSQQDMAMQEFEEAQLEPLKNIEESLKVELETLKSRNQLLEDQEKAANDMRKNGAKDFTPEYTGGG